MMDRKEYLATHKEQRKATTKKYRDSHKKQLKEYNAKYFVSHIEERKAWQKEYDAAHKEERKVYELMRREKKIQYLREYLKSHRKERNEYARNKKLSDPVFKMKHSLRNRLLVTFKNIGKNKPAKTEQLLGTDYLTVKKHIEQQFNDGMGWHNQGKWHIDHIIPLASAKDIDELIALCHYSNLQPLWAIDNCIKGARINIDL